ncbi:hypothetical protein B0H10DRAFT_2187366, partial [Mycena sp. CBHHK59/15]
REFHTALCGPRRPFPTPSKKNSRGERKIKLIGGAILGTLAALSTQHSPGAITSFRTYLHWESELKHVDLYLIHDPTWSVISWVHGLQSLREHRYEQFQSEIAPKLVKTARRDPGNLGDR